MNAFVKAEISAFSAKYGSPVGTPKAPLATAPAPKATNAPFTQLAVTAKPSSSSSSSSESEVSEEPEVAPRRQFEYPWMKYSRPSQNFSRRI